MLTFNSFGNASPILLTVVLIAYLIAYEFGNQKIRKSLLPLVVVMIIAFFITAALSIYSIYTKLG